MPFHEMPIEGSDGSLDDARAFEEKINDDDSLEPLALEENSLLFEMMKTKDSKTENFQDSWGNDGFICCLPSDLTEKCRVESITNQSNKKKKFLLFPKRVSSTNTSLDSSGSSYVGPKPFGSNGKPLKSCMSASYSTGTGSLDESEGSVGDLILKPLKRNVSFDLVHFREYERALGDNPSVSSGPPLSIGWAHTETVALPLDDYEKMNPKSRTKEELVVPAPIRALILREQAHVGRSHLRMAEKEVNIIKNQRRWTSQMLHQRGLHEAFETVQRKLKRVVTGKSKQKEEDDLWEKAQIGI
jgi:hypothetical protein